MNSSSTDSGGCLYLDLMCWAVLTCLWVMSGSGVPALIVPLGMFALAPLWRTRSGGSNDVA